MGYDLFLKMHAEIWTLKLKIDETRFRWGIFGLLYGVFLGWFFSRS